MPTKNGQFDYPTEGWSTGKMRKKGLRQGTEGGVEEGAGALGDNPVIDTIERLHQERKKGQGISSVPGMELARLPTKMRSGVSGGEFREIEGQRKSKQDRLSQAEMMEALSAEDWGKYWGGNWNVVGPGTTVDPSKVDPSGVVMPQGHPQIKELQEGGWDALTIPDEGWGKSHIFMRPKATPAMVAQGEGGRVA
jgi:hypothetical protein